MTMKRKMVFALAVLISAWSGLLRAASLDTSYFPRKADSYRDYKVGMVHGAQYWVHEDATRQSIERDFRLMATEDHINSIRLPFWALYWYAPDRQLTEKDWRLADICFEMAAKYDIQVNPVLPYIPGWVDGTADQPEIRAGYKAYIQELVARFKDQPALAMWTVDIEPSRSYKVDPCEETLALYREWLPQRYSSVEEFTKLNGIASFAEAYPMNARDKGPWNNFQGFNDYLTFTAWALAEQTLFTVTAVKEADAIHPTSCTPPDTLHNQIIENGRNMWWLADTVDYPGSQMHPHWHMETADMPEDVLSAQACSIRKVYNSARGRDASYVGEVMCGPEIAFESTRFYTVTADELLCTALTHLGEGVKGFYYWIWNPLKQGPIAGAWPYRNPDGSPSDRSRLSANVGKMFKKHNDLLYEMKPADNPVAIFDSLDAAIYMGRRSYYQPMSEWYVKNQYGFFKAMRKMSIGCDFIDEIGLNNGTLERYDCLYVPFAMTMEKDVAAVLKEYVQNGGTIIADTLTAFTPRYHLQYPEYPGCGLQEVFGIKPLLPQAVYDGWTEVDKHVEEKYFDRLQTHESESPFAPLYTPHGSKSALVAWKMMEPVERVTAKVLLQDDKGRAVCTVNRFGKGHAIWTGTLLGYSCRPADTPASRYKAMAQLLQPYMRSKPWKLTAPPNTVICRRLTGPKGDVYVLTNEGENAARFTLDFGRSVRPRELLWPDDPCWQKDWFSSKKINGTLKPLGGTVVFVPR